MKKQNKRWVALTTIAILMAAVAIYLKSSDNNESLKPSPSPTSKGISAGNIIPVNGEILKASALSEEIITVGNIIPDKVVDLTFETSGKIIGIYLKEGSKVKQGELLAKINDAPLQAQLKKLEAELPLINQRVYRQEELLKRDAISKEAYDIVVTDLAKLNADIELVKAQIALTELRAPFDGVIGLRKIDEGAYATTGTPLATLTKVQPVKIDFSYPERYTNQIVKNTPITFYIDGVLEPFKTNVYAVEPLVQDDVKTQNARALHTNEDLLLTPGKFVNVNIVLEEKNNALTVPSEALITEIGKSILYLYKNGTATPITVETGLRTESRVEVLTGVQLGDTIITTGMMQLRPGIQVKLESIN